MEFDQAEQFTSFRTYSYFYQLLWIKGLWMFWPHTDQHVAWINTNRLNYKTFTKSHSNPTQEQFFLTQVIFKYCSVLFWIPVILLLNLSFASDIKKNHQLLISLLSNSTFSSAILLLDLWPRVNFKEFFSKDKIFFKLVVGKGEGVRIFMFFQKDTILF